MACFFWPSLTLNGFKWLQNSNKDNEGQDDDDDDYDNDSADDDENRISKN